MAGDEQLQAVNKLTDYLKRSNFSEQTAMNILQGDAGIASDNAVTPEDVAEPDASEAVERLKGLK